VNNLAKYDLNIDQGCSYIRSMKWTDSNGQPINTTGYSGKIQIKQNTTRPSVVELTILNGITISNTGDININISTAKTSLLSSTKYIYDFIITDRDQNKIKLLYGDVNVSQEITT
jgi:hypothetical protein